MADNARARKLADRIQVVVAETLDRRIKDPRLGFVTITDARVTGDLREATVFYTVYGDDEERAASAAALESAKGVLRSEVGRQTGVRFTPTLAFVPDAPARQRPHHRRPARQGAEQGRRGPPGVGGREVRRGGGPVPQAR
ncbi:ribosome-binding factor A [Streptomyces sp. BvitLS-983]|nr:ribosome-binding factor A [Streptomyces sp. BvitLS-983]